MARCPKTLSILKQPDRPGVGEPHYVPDGLLSMGSTLFWSLFFWRTVAVSLRWLLQVTRETLLTCEAHQCPSVPNPPWTCVENMTQALSVWEEINDWDVYKLWWWLWILVCWPTHVGMTRVEKKTYYELVVSLYHVADSKDNVYMCIETFIAKVICSSTIIIDSRFLATPTA